jgi:hypothetical protein
MNERRRNQGERPGPGTGAGSRQQEQQTAGGSMQTGVDPGDGRPSDAVQMRQQGGTYRPEGDRGVEFQADQGRDIGFEDDRQLDDQLRPGERGGQRQQAQQSGARRQPDECGRSSGADRSGRSDER